MADDIENLLQRYRPVDPPAALRQKILGSRLVRSTPAPVRWPVYVFRSSVAAAIVFSFGLLHAANTLNQQTAVSVGMGLPKWTADAQQAADLIDPNGSAGRRYIALCLLADNARPSPSPQGEIR